MKNKLGRRMGAGVIGGALLCANLAMCAEAAAPKAVVDESLYVTMDYYGGYDDVSLVKGVTLNGQKTLEDYGTYDEIINMSNRVEPLVEGDKVTWNLEDQDDKMFYFEVKGEHLTERIPWKIDVSYKLNGVPVKGEELAGASGLVSTSVHVSPNKDLPEYYQNNMILICAAMADMNDVNSFEAPGAQLQTVGTAKAAIFMALPGEDSEFVYNIGSDCYESMGTFFMMVPATLESLEMVNDIRDVKDTVEDSIDAMNDALDVILDNVADMKEDVQNIHDGIDKAQTAHGVYQDNREVMDANADAAIRSIENIVTYLEVINTQSEVDKENLNETIDRLIAVTTDVANLTTYGEQVKWNIDGLEDYVRQLQDISEATVTQEGIEKLQAIVGTAGGDPAVTVSQIVMQQIASKTGQSIATVGTIVGSQGAGSPQAAEIYAAYVKAVEELGYTPTTAGTALADPSGTDVGMKSLLTTYIQALETYDASAGSTSASIMRNSADLIHMAYKTLDSVDGMTDNLQRLNYWTNNTVREDLNTLISQTQDLIDAMEVSLGAAQASLQSIRYTMELTEDTLASSITLTLKGLSGVTGKGVNIIDGVDVMRNAKNTMKDAIDDEMDEIEEDYNVLNLDVTQAFPSFTSDKNATPGSIQIIMRTAEISVDDGKDNVTDIETPREDIGVWGRFLKVFTDLWEKIMSLFR